MNKPAIVFTALFAHLSAPLASDDFERATLALCNKIKSCAMEVEVAETSAINLAEQACSNIRQQYRMIAVKPALQKAAAACMESKARLTCDAINNDTETSECTDLYALTD